MSYQVLARKYRPKSFRELVGQEHVARALINALDQDRLHHAYLFTGTRGVGKTTIARILSKCLNCETGVSSEPCGVCGTCREIDEGRFVDLIEVDAASRTKVEDTRELLDNVQYAPTRGRYKVYLIDEVHMLSGHSFNALLKTLEEPPPHVKFLLATTDPQKLPITILSRCLQFALKPMSPERVVGHLSTVLNKEMVGFEEPALWELGRAANGSMRDALSLTDQAIAFGNGRLTEAEVRSMLGSIDRDLVFRVLEAVNSGDAAAVLGVVTQLAEQSVDFAGALTELISCLHRLAVAQHLPDAIDNALGDRDRVLALAAAMTAEDVQLYYQIALHGRRDLPLAAEPRSGFEMALLRMLSFRPVPTQPDAAGQGRGAPAVGGGMGRPAPAQRPSAPMPQASRAPAATAQAAVQAVARPQPLPAPVAAPIAVPTPAVAAEQRPSNVVAFKPQEQRQPEPVVAPPVVVPEPAVATIPGEWSADAWEAWVRACGLTGSALNLARHSALIARGDNRFELELAPKHEMLASAAPLQQLEARLAEQLPGAKLQLKLVEPSLETPTQIIARRKAQRLKAAEAALLADSNVQALMQEFGAQLISDSIIPID